MSRPRWEVMPGIGDGYLQTMCADVETWKFREDRLPAALDNLHHWQELIIDDVSVLAPTAMAYDEIGTDITAKTNIRPELAVEALNAAIFAEAVTSLKNTTVSHEFGDEYRRAHVTIIEPGVRLYLASTLAWRGLRHVHREAELGEEFFGTPVKLTSNPLGGGHLLLRGPRLYATMDGIINTEHRVHPRIKLDWLAKV